MKNISVILQFKPFAQDQQSSVPNFNEVYPVVMLINLGVSVFGIVANVASIATFIKQGFKESIDVSLIALAVTDMVSLICLLWMCTCYNKSFCDLICDVIDLVRVAYLTGGVPRAYFTILSGCITTLVAFERCLCVVKPLQVKVIFTKKRLGVALPSVFLAVLGPFIPVYLTTGLGWVYQLEKNRTVLSLTFSDDRHDVDNICFGFMVAMNLFTYIAVFVCTFIIVWKLASQSAWRSQRTNANVGITSPGAVVEDSKSNHETKSEPTAFSKDHGASQDSREQQKPTDKKKSVHGRDRRATQTVTFIAAMYIVCFFPGAVLQLVMACEPEFNKGMKYSEYFQLSSSLAYIGEAVCSSSNIVIYLKTSTRFRKTFLSLFGVSNGL